MRPLPRSRLHCPIVPSTSGWPAWPISTTSRPARQWRATSKCTFVTSGQVASNTFSPRRSASRRTACETPWALKITVTTSGTSGRSSTKMARVADTPPRGARAELSSYHIVTLGPPWAVSHDHLRPTPLGLQANRLRDAVGAEDNVGVVGDFVQLLDEDRAALLEVVDHVAVVHDFVAHVDRRAERLDRTLDDLDRAVDAGAEAAGIGEDDVHKYPFYRRPDPETLVFGNRSDSRTAHTPLSRLRGEGGPLARHCRAGQIGRAHV